MLFSWCKLLCSLRALRVANLQKPKMGSKQSVPSRRHSLSTYEVMFAALFAILVVLCAGLIAVAWLSIKGSERGKSHRLGYRKVLSGECIHFNLQNPASILYALLCFHGKVFILHPDASP